MEMAHAIAIETPESWRCSQVSSHMLASPPTWAPPAGDSRSEKMKLMASKKSFTWPPPLWSRA